MRNVMVNGYEQQVEIFPLALSNRPGVLTLYGASGPSASLIKGWAGYSASYKQLIPVSTLDVVLNTRFVDKQLFVKIDVEGAEYQVLAGAQAVLSRARKPIWLLEVCLQEFHPSGVNPDYRKIFDLFWEQGYQAYTATEPAKLVTKQDVAAWMETKDDRFRIVQLCIHRPRNDSRDVTGSRINRVIGRGVTLRIVSWGQSRDGSELARGNRSVDTEVFCNSQMTLHSGPRWLRATPGCFGWNGRNGVAGESSAPDWPLAIPW